MSYSTFLHATGTTIIAFSDWQQAEHGNELADALVRAFIHKDQTATLPCKEGSEQAFIDAVAFGFGDVNRPYKSLAEVVEYIERTPPAGVERAAYLQYHLEHWLHTLYVLKERTRSYITTVARLYRGTTRQSALASCARNGHAVFADTFREMLGIRGHHVHVSAAIPPALSELEVFDAMTAVYGKVYTHPAVPDYEALVADWATVLRQGNSEVTRVLDEIFSEVHPLLFNGEQPIFPPALPGA